MKKIIFILAIMVSACQVGGQNNIDALFNKYSGNDGFLTLTLSGDLLNLLNVTVSDENDDGMCHRWSAHVTEIRLLIQEDDEIPAKNFYESVMRGIDKSPYDEFMRVNQSDQDLIMLVKCQGNVIREFLVIGGGDDNLLIQVKGNMTRSEAKCFSDNLRAHKGARIVASIH